MKSRKKASVNSAPRVGTKTAARKISSKVAQVSSSRSSRDFTGSRPPRLGLEATVEQVVPLEWTIQAIDSRLPPVLSTPAMIGLMEHATANAVRAELPEGAISVGTRIEVDHLKAVADGATIQAHARLVGYQGRFLVFEVEASSRDHVIGRGRVFRAIVRPDLHGANAKSHIKT